MTLPQKKIGYKSKNYTYMKMTPIKMGVYENKKYIFLYSQYLVSRFK